MAATGRSAAGDTVREVPGGASDETGPVTSAAIAEGEVAELYVALSRRLRAIVRAVVPTSEAIVEDACQVAWFRLIRHRRRVQRDRALAWLGATAVHEAQRLAARQLREASLEEELSERGECRLSVHAPAVDEVLELRERLRTQGNATPRQRRLIWLQAMGWSYLEIARHEGCTPRTVHRQLPRAKRALGVTTAPSHACAAGARPD